MKQSGILFLVLLLHPLFSIAFSTSKVVVIDDVKFLVEFNTDHSGQEDPIGAIIVSNEENPYSGSFTIPNSIDVELNMNDKGEIKPYVAKCKVTGVSTYAFENCTNLSSLYIPSTVYGFYDTSSSNSDGFLSFSGCRNLTKIVVDENNEKFDSRDNCNAIIRKDRNVLIGGCKSSTIPNSVSIILSNAFKDCVDLTTISIPQSVYMIESEAFSGCSNIKDVYCYSKPNFIGANEVAVNPFAEIASNAILHVKDVDIESFKADKGWNVFKEIVPIEKITDFSLTYYVDGVEYQTVQYKYDDEITPLEEPSMDGYTFSGWSEIPSKMPGKDVKVEGTFIKNEVNENGIIYFIVYERAVVTGSDNVTGDVKIPLYVTYNEKEIPVTDIFNIAFQNNTHITSVEIPDSIRMIGSEAFYGCKNLTTISMGKKMALIGVRAFAGIDNLTDITIYAEEVPETDRTAFENSYIEDYVTLHVPAGSLEKYKAAAPWKNFKEIVAIEGTEAEPAKYTLTYQVDGETYKTFELEEGAKITALEEPTKDGYTFSGWSDIPKTMPAEDIIIKGTFTQNESKEEETKKTDVDEITIGKIEKTTYCSEYDLDFTNVAGIKAYTATGYDNKSKTIWLTRVMTVPAGTGILVKGEAGTYKIPRSTEDAYYTNMFKGNTGDPIKIEETDGDMTNYYLSGSDGQFKSVNGNANIGKNKAYLQLPSKFFAGTRSVGVAYDDEGTTSIFNIERGTLSNERDVWFNLQGQRVDKPRKGLYIRNGKKVLVK